MVMLKKFKCTLKIDPYHIAQNFGGRKLQWISAQNIIGRGVLGTLQSF